MLHKFAFFEYEYEDDEEDDLSKTELLNSKHDIRHLSSLLIPPFRVETGGYPPEAPTEPYERD